jgi:hypothetical protein
MKGLSKMARGFLATTVLLLAAMTACDNGTMEPSGSFVPAPGLPIGNGTEGGSGGIPDSSYKGPRFDINNPPSPSTWNALGHQHAFPDLFHFANGNKVVTLADWESRRKEISKILQYYEYGVMPSIKEEDGVHITFNHSGAAGATITVSYEGREFSFTINTTLPAGADESKKGTYPLYFGSSGANWEGGTASWDGGTFGGESDGSGAVHTLFGINTADGDAPSANMDYAWGMSVILTAMEGIDLNGDGEIDPETEKAFHGWYDPAKVGITGYSRYGKAAECIAAFAESRNGHRIGHVAIGSAGSGGPSLERFLSPAGYKINNVPVDPLPLDKPGLMEFEGLVGKPWYMKKIQIPTDAATTPGGNADEWRYKTVRGWAPYYEDYEGTPTNYSTQVTTPFVGWQNPADAWSGIQSLSEGRNETPGWFSKRFQEFADLHYGLDIDHVRGNEGRGKYGILCTIPFDQHFLAALIPPNGVIFQDGYVVPRNNPESQFANWLIIDEVYKLYGEAEGDPEKYIWRNAFMMTWGTHGNNTGNEAADRNYHAMKIFNDQAGSGSQADANLLKMRTPAFMVDDPIGRFDYYRMTWGRPGHPTIAERVQRRLPTALIAEYEAHLPPAPASGVAQNAPRNDKPEGYTYDGPKFRAMDWRGLIDEPEAE